MSSAAVVIGALRVKKWEVVVVVERDQVTRRKRAFLLVSSLLKHSLLHFSMFIWFFAVPVSTNETFQTLKNDGLGKAEF